MKILAFESSCDETAVAVVEDGRKILSDAIASQADLHALYGGVVPEIASRKHIEAIAALTDQALKEAGVEKKDIDAVAATYAPGLIGAVLVGMNFAKSAAYALNVPLIPVHHIRGHIAANYLAFPELEPPFLALCMSGGNTLIVDVRDYTDFALLGATRDDAAGECFDKAARVLGLPYPGGAAMDKLAHESEGGVYDVIPAQEVDLSAQREAVIGQKVNATYDKETGAVTPGHAGVEFTLSDLESAYNAAAAGETVDLPNATVETPDVTAEQLQKVLFRDVLSTYTTKVGGASGRRANVKLTASRITGYILNSGETMKYGPLVTPFTAANGYSTAPGYLQGKTVDMVGGGACQASSTLYAAALYANLEIVQRTNHGFASDYIGLGLDATVAQGGPEFEFRNNTNYPIKVVAEYYASGGKNYLKVSLLGTKVDDTYVKIKTDVLETIPFSEQIVETDELAPGERKVEQTAYTGYKVKTYRNVYSGDGKLISSTFEASSNYKARNRIVLVGKSAAVTPTDPITPVDPGTTTPTDPTTPVDPGTTTNPGTTTDPGVTDPGTTTEPPVEQEKPSWLDTGLDR